mmetsp:Transcript_17246/g.16576  ORF Transcript_17246/g.16576 Transcript_17246/m.16576 type:complete len:192 (+) Transcript_17246:136-711(+)
MRRALINLPRNLGPVGRCFTLHKSVVLNQIRHGGSISVILLDDVENRGERGEIVKVKRGYARNLLIPRKRAAYVTEDNRIKHERLLALKSNTVLDIDMEEGIPQSNLKYVIDSETIQFGRLTIEGTDNLFGSVTAGDIKNLLEDSGYEPVDVDSIQLQTPIRTLGIHSARIGGVLVKINVIEDSPIKMSSA